jgi:dihydrolipoamide dehydrogenase
MHFYLSSTVSDIKAEQDCVTATIKDKDQKEHKLKFDAVIVAIGITGNVENLGLENTKIAVENNQIKVNKWCETDQSGIYAIGDVAGAPWLAHKASHEGILVAEKIAGIQGLHFVDRNKIPGCTYSIPQIASIGITQEKAEKTGLKVKIGRFPYRGNGKAIALGESEGLIKTIFDEETGELLGAHMIGAEVTEMIQGYSIAKNLEATEQDLMHTVFPHPTLSEMMHESVLDAYDKAIHM